MPEIHARKIDESAVETILQEDFVLEGNATIIDGLALKGRIVGNIDVEKNIFIDKQASVIGNIESRSSLYLLGTLKGDVKTTHRVEVIGKGCLDGDVITGRMVIENGSTFNGICKMGSDHA